MTSLRQEAMAISINLKKWEKSWLKIGGGGFDEWLEGGVTNGNSKFSTNSVHLISSKAIWAKLLRVPTGSKFEIICSISLMVECLTDLFGLPRGL